jgi:hypothetical protein
MFFIFQSNEIRFETFQNENDKKPFSMHYERHFVVGFKNYFSLKKNSSQIIRTLNIMPFFLNHISLNLN